MPPRFTNYFDSLQLAESSPVHIRSQSTGCASGVVRYRLLLGHFIRHLPQHRSSFLQLLIIRGSKTRRGVCAPRIYWQSRWYYQCSIMSNQGSRASSAQSQNLAAPANAAAAHARSVVDKAMEVQTIGPLMEHGGCELKLVNVTATANVGCKLNLQDVVMRARNAEYNPKRFSACVSDHVSLDCSQEVSQLGVLQIDGIA